MVLDEETVTRLHKMSRGEIWDAGLYKERDAYIIERYPDGRERVRFRTVSAEATPEAVRSFRGNFTLGDLERACPGIGRDMVRRVLRDLKAAQKVECLGRGSGAQWRKKG